MRFKELSYMRFYNLYFLENKLEKTPPPLGNYLTILNLSF